MYIHRGECPWQLCISSRLHRVPLFARRFIHAYCIVGVITTTKHNGSYSSGHSLQRLSIHFSFIPSQFGLCKAQMNVASTLHKAYSISVPGQLVFRRADGKDLSYASQKTRLWCSACALPTMPFTLSAEAFVGKLLHVWESS